MKKILLILLGSIGGFILLVSVFLFYLGRDLDSNAALEIDSIDMALIDDGTYVGSHEGGRFSNTVEVTVEAGNITNVRLIDSVRFDRPEITEALLERITEENTLDVDIEAGATVTSLAYMKAIEDALTKGLNND